MTDNDPATAIARLAQWSPWVRFADAIACAPTTPGVYLARLAEGHLVYVGMAGERRGKGIRGRLAVYGSGKAATSGLGEAALNRALADLDFVRARADELATGQARTAQGWARAALDHAGLMVCWAPTPDRAAAAALEHAVLIALGATNLWNVARPRVLRPSPTTPPGT